MLSYTNKKGNKMKLTYYVKKQINSKDITDVNIDGAAMADYPDLSDAYITNITHKNESLTAEDCESLQEENNEWFYELALEAAREPFVTSLPEGYKHGI
tara:strand:+ start:15524 stop:15820 length:297 start_codon:yes stop_codon:yes gene_type:complete